MKITRIVSLLFAAHLALLSGAAAAQDVPDAIIHNEGIGFSRVIDGELVVFDLVAAYDNHAIVEADCSAYQAQVKGVNWCFATEENKAAFEAETQENGNNKYLPFVGGHCALGMANGNLTATGDPRTAVRIGNQLVLNGRFVVRTRFLEDSERNMDNATLRYQLALAAGELRSND